MEGVLNPRQFTSGSEVERGGSEGFAEEGVLNPIQLTWSIRCAKVEIRVEALSIRRIKE